MFPKEHVYVNFETYNGRKEEERRKDGIKRPTDMPLIGLNFCRYC